MTTGTLKDVADREAAEAEAAISAEEAADETPAAPPTDPAASHVTVWDRAPSQTDFDLAGEWLSRLEDGAHEMTPDQTVDALVKVVDVHPRFRMPQEWPGESDEVLHGSAILGDIGRFLLRGCRAKLEVSPRDVVFLWRNKKTWTSRGVEVRCKPKALSELERHQTGAVAAVVANFRLFHHLTTVQKISAVYGALRRLDKKGKVIPPQFEGFFDELHLFGLGTFEADANLARAVELGRGRDDELPWRVKADEFDYDEDDDDEDGVD